MKKVWFGLDVSKDWFDASCVRPGTTLNEFASIPHRRFSRDPGAVRRFLAWVRETSGDQPARVIMEVTGNYSLELCSWIVEKRPDLEPAIVNPKQAKHFHKSLGLRNKTDQVDCRSLGLMGQERRPKPYQQLPPEYQEIRDLMRQRRHFVDTRTQQKQRLHEQKNGSASVRRVLQSHILHLEKLLKRVQKSIDKVLDSSPALRQDLALLQTIPGVAWVTALTVLGELGDLRRYNRSRQVSALSGLSPRNHISGTSINYSHIDRNGSPHLRAALYMAGTSAATRSKDNTLVRNYQRLLDKGKEKQQAIVAIARKIVVIMRALLIHEQPYKHDFQPA